MDSTINTVVVGASCFGCGLAAALGKDTLVLESSAVPGSDFALTFDPGRDFAHKLSHSEVGEIRRELEIRKILVDGRLQPAACTPVLAKWCIDRKLNIVFSCDLIEIAADRVVYQAVDGIHMVRCRRVIDARPKFNGIKYYTVLTSTAHMKENQKTSAPNPAPEPGRYGDFEIISLLPREQCCVKLALPADTSWPEARRRFDDAWSKRPPELAALAVLLGAVRFSSGTEINMLTALDRGFDEGEKK